MNLHVKNCSLCNKWIRHFGGERESFWEHIVAEKNSMNANYLLPSCHNYRRMSSVWRNVVSPLLNNGHFSGLMKACIRFLLVKSDCIKFWQDIWIDNLFLCVAFP